VTPEETAKALGEQGISVLDELDPNGGPELASMIRSSFEEGNEQGNGYRLEALVKLEGEGAIDILCAVLEDTVEVGGIYSNLRNTALELIQGNFLGHPQLAASLWKAVEIDEYLNIDQLYAVARPYDAERAAALLVPAAEQGIPAAIRALAGEPALRPTLFAILERSLAGENPAVVVAALGDAAREPDIAAMLAPHADSIPAVAELNLDDADEARLRTLADKLSSNDPAWCVIAIRALQRLAPSEAFDRASPVFLADDRATPQGRARATAVTWALSSFAAPRDPRWPELLVAQLAVEDDLELRGSLVHAISAFGADFAPTVIGAARDAKDKYVLAAIPEALQAIGPDDGVLDLVRQAAVDATGKHKAALEETLEMFDEA